MCVLPGLEVAGYLADKASSVTVVGRSAVPLKQVLGSKVGLAIKKVGHCAVLHNMELLYWVVNCVALHGLLKMAAFGVDENMAAGLTLDIILSWAQLLIMCLVINYVFSLSSPHNTLSGYLLVILSSKLKTIIQNGLYLPVGRGAFITSSAFNENKSLNIYRYSIHYWKP